MITNPFDGDKSLDWVREKWGRPKIIRKHQLGFFYQCAVCEAGWVGPIGDWCEWCHNRWIGNKERILFPEFINWGEAYERLSPIDRQVWATTRGFTGAFIDRWQSTLFDAITIGLVTDVEASESLKRYQEWKIHMQQFES